MFKKSANGVSQGDESTPHRIFMTFFGVSDAALSCFFSLISAMFCS
jgi:hypothetical protein